MINKLQIILFEKHDTKTLFLVVFFGLISLVSIGQVKSSIDVKSIKIGEEITYKIEVETDTTNYVVFPEGQTFQPLEMIESYKVDTVRKDATFQLIKKYGLTQFDSGHYVIPKQKVIISNKTIALDSLLVEVNSIAVDTTKQNLYDIKPIIKVETPKSYWWLYALGVLLILALVGFLIYWFIWRKKPLTEDEKIALLPPYDRAKLALKKLDESGYLEQDAYKDYYSELTLAIRKYLDEQVYDRALESTTDELITKLTLLREAHQIELSESSLRNLEGILKRADLVKFAKSAPDKELAILDRKVVDEEIDHVKEALPEPSEEEKLLDEKYRLEEERKKRQHNILLSACVLFVLAVLTFATFGFKYGFANTVDTIIRKETKLLLENEWVKSDYGFPPITLETPVVLKRDSIGVSKDMVAKIKMSTFKYELEEKILITTTTTQFLPETSASSNPNPNTGQEQPEIDMEKAVEGSIKQLENRGSRNILFTNKKFTTPNGAEGLETSGTLERPIKEGSKDYIYGNFTILTFASNEDQVLQQIFITYLKDDVYLNQIHDRIIDSIELKPKKDEEN
jgi:hypothetical protein